MISVEQALDIVIAGVSPVSTEMVGLDAALGRVLAEDVAARVSQPPVDVSAMDGYAVRAADVARVPVRLRVVGESAAGGTFSGSLATGQAVRIFTGAAMPAGADTIVIQEDTKLQGDTVCINASADAGRWLRKAGLDFRAGQVLLDKGKRLTAIDIGLAAAMNVPWLKMRRKPNIALLATGDELVMPGEPLSSSNIVNSNSFLLAAYISSLGASATNLGIVRDNRKALAEAVTSSRQHDLLVTMGGASVGDYDLVRPVLNDLGLELGFSRVAMRPGKPVLFGTINSLPVLALPGNPVSVGVTAIVFLRPAVEKLLALTDRRDSPTTAVLGRDLDANDHRQDYLRARLSTDPDGNLRAIPFARQDSSMLSLLAHAECLVIRSPHAKPAKSGDIVEILPLASPSPLPEQDPNQSIC